MPSRLKTARRQKIRASLLQVCVACGATEQLTLDHIIPLVYGGDNARDNFQILCERCQARKAFGEKRHWHPAANRAAGNKLRKKLAKARLEAALALVILVETFNFYNMPSTQKEWEESPTYDEVVDKDYEQGADAEYEQGADAEFDDTSQRDFGDDVRDPDAQEGSQEWYARKQK